MLKFFISISLLVSMAQIASAQHKGLYLGLDFAKIHDRLSVSNANSAIGQAYPHFVEPSSTFTLGYQFRDWLSVETGFVHKPFENGFSLQTDEFSQFGSGTGLENRWQIPIRIRNNQLLFNDRFRVHTAVGFHFGYDPTTPALSPILNLRVDERDLSILVSERGNRYYSLLEAQLSLEYVLTKRFSLVANASVFKGLVDFRRTEIQVLENGQLIDENVLIEDGSYHSFALGVRFRPFKSKQSFKSNAKDVRLSK